MINPWRSLSGLPRSLFVLAGATLVNRAGTMVLPFLALYLTRHLGFEAETAGAMFVLWGSVSLITAPIAGRLCDLVGSTRVLIGSLIGAGVVMLLYPLARTVSEVAVATIALAFVGEAFRPASMTLFAELAPEGRKKHAFALQRLAINLGMSVGPAAGGLLATRWFAGIFYVDGITSLGAAAVLVVALRREAAAKPVTASLDESADEPVAEPVDVVVDGRRAYTDWAFVYFLAAIIANAFVFFQLDAAMPLYMVRDLGISETTFGLLFTINTIIIIFVEVPLNARMATWSTPRAMALGAVLVAFGFGAIGLAVGPFTMGLTVVVWTFGEMILFPTSAAYVSEVSPKGRGGEYMGAFSMAFGVPFALAPFAGTVVLERFGGQVLWGGAFVLGVVSAVMMRFVRPAAAAEAAA